MSDFHLKAELPPDATDREVTDIRAKAFQTALMHAAADPLITIKMLVGAAGHEYETAVYMLAHKIWKAGPDAIALAKKIAEEPGLMVGSCREAGMADLHTMIVKAAMPRLAELERLAKEQGRLPG